MAFLAKDVSVRPKLAQKKIKTFEIRLETEDPEYVNEEWLKVALNEAFQGPEFHEPEGDHPPKLISVSKIQNSTMF